MLSLSRTFPLNPMPPTPHAHPLTRQLAPTLAPPPCATSLQGFIIPTPVVRNFLSVYEATGTFGRLPSLGIGTQTLTNKAMRGLLLGGGISQPPHHDGVLITRVRRFSCAESAGVKPGDILMGIDGTKVSEEGEVTFRGHERVEFEYLITTKKVGDSVTLSLLRSPHGASETHSTFDINALAESPEVPKPLELRVTLAPTHELVPRELYKDYTPEYVVVGGLVFVIAGLPVLEQAMRREDWALFQAIAEQMRPPPLTEASAAGGAAADGGGGGEASSSGARDGERDAQALICSGCLAHDVNEGFRRFVGDRLLKVNGVRVKNLKHVVELLLPVLDPSVEPPPRSHVALQFANVPASVLFETGALRAATPLIQEQHKIPAWTSLKLEAAASTGPAGVGRLAADGAKETLGSPPPPQRHFKL